MRRKPSRLEVKIAYNESLFGMIRLALLNGLIHATNHWRLTLAALLLAIAGAVV